jgi:NADPH:quinone reductase-like Zn-dependent oxidoreductase
VKGGHKRIESFVVGGPGSGSGFGADLAYLTGLLERKALDPQIGWRGPWERAPEAADALLARRVLGKAVLDIGR